MKFYFKVWEIIISWDILTLNENIDVACKTQGVRQERTDFQGVMTYRDFQVNIQQKIHDPFFYQNQQFRKAKMCV